MNAPRLPNILKRPCHRPIELVHILRGRHLRPWREWLHVRQPQLLLSHRHQPVTSCDAQVGAVSLSLSLSLRVRVRVRVRACVCVCVCVSAQGDHPSGHGRPSTRADRGRQQRSVPLLYLYRPAGGSMGLPWAAGAADPESCLTNMFHSPLTGGGSEKK